MKKYDIVQNIFIKAPPSRVFYSLTDSKEIAKWFLKEVEIEPKAGGKFKLGWGAFSQEEKIIEIVQDKLISFTWNTGPKFPTGPVVTFRLEPKSGGTVVTLEHKGFPIDLDNIKTLAGNSQGWSACLCGLKAYVENGLDLRDPNLGMVAIVY